MILGIIIKKGLLKATFKVRISLPGRREAREAYEIKEAEENSANVWEKNRARLRVVF